MARRWRMLLIPGFFDYPSVWALVPPQWMGLSRTTKLGPVMNHKSQTILEFIKRHNPFPKGLVHVGDRLAEHEKNKASKNA